MLRWRRVIVVIIRLLVITPWAGIFLLLMKVVYTPRTTLGVTVVHLDASVFP
jgi:hypothetical protein